LSRRGSRSFYHRFERESWHLCKPGQKGKQLGTPHHLRPSFRFCCHWLTNEDLSNTADRLRNLPEIKAQMGLAVREVLFPDGRRLNWQYKDVTTCLGSIERPWPRSVSNDPIHHRPWSSGSEDDRLLCNFTNSGTESINSNLVFVESLPPNTDRPSRLREHFHRPFGNSP